MSKIYSGLIPERECLWIISDKIHGKHTIDSFEYKIPKWKIYIKDKVYESFNDCIADFSNIPSYEKHIGIEEYIVHYFKEKVDKIEITFFNECVEPYKEEASIHIIEINDDKFIYCLEKEELIGVKVKYTLIAGSLDDEENRLIKPIVDI